MNFRAASRTSDSAVVPGCGSGSQSHTEQMRPVLWAIAMGGGYANWYVGTTAWDVIVPGDITPGYSYCRHLISFFTSSSYWLLEPNDALITTSPDTDMDTAAGYVLADPAGSELLAYVSVAGPFMLKLPGPSTQRWEGGWFDPRSGQSQPVANVTSATTDFMPPALYDKTGDVALRLTRVAAAN